MAASAVWRTLLIGTCLLSAAGCSDDHTSSDKKATSQPEATSGKAFDMEDQATGKAPAGFLLALTGSGEPPEWVVLEDPQAASGRKVLAQTSEDRTDHRFAVCVYDGLSAKDVEVSVRFRPVSGEVDQSGGIVVRYQDKDNYYVVRANALEDNVRFYMVIDGRRRQIAGARATIASGEWHRLSLALKGSHFQISLEGTPLFEVDDGTISDPGKVGVWTKSDSRTDFDDLEVTVHDRR